MNGIEVTELNQSEKLSEFGLISDELNDKNW